MQKKLVQSSLALTAAAALGLGGAFVAGPAAAGPQQVLTEQQAVKAAKSVDAVNAFGFDAKTKTLHLGVEGEGEADSKQIQDLKKKYGAEQVEVVTGIEEAEPYAKNDAVGGMGYLSMIPSQPGYQGACSTGFAGWSSSGEKLVLTAGHCAEDDAPGNLVDLKDTELPSTAPAVTGDHEKGGYDPQNIGPLGEWGFNKFGSVAKDSKNPDEAKADDIDFAVINVGAEYNVKPEITDWKSASTDDLSGSTTPITKVGSHTSGAIQKSGRTTGLTSGEVAAGELYPFDYQVVGDRWVHGFGVTSPVGSDFSLPGDSGGGVFQGNTAVGVISGGIPEPVTVGDDTFMWSWVADLDYSLEQSNVDFQLTDPNEEPPGDDDANADAGADAKDAEADAGADAKDADAAAAADADAKDAEADAGADAKDADAAAAADGDDAKADADADAKDADASAAADGDDANADADADAPDAPDAPAVDDQKVDEGGKITGKTEANAKVKLGWKPAATNGEQSAVKAQAAAQGSVTVTADAEGNFTAEAPSEAGTYAYTATATTDAGTSKATSFTVVVEADADDAAADSADADSAANGDDANAEADADGNDSDAGAAADAKNAESNADSDGSKDGEAPAERKISIEPKEVAASDFVKKDKGVQITVKGFEEGENVSLEVVAGPENVEGITLDETANEDGVAAFSIYGTNASDPSAYLGKYDVQVTGANDTDDEKALAGSFSVVADEDGNGGGSDDGDGGDGGSDLPRTGAELTGLAAGAGLLVVGGAAVVLTMRRNKKN
ncbi:LPXTG cell wall anchor domain-containing protein [Brevibacterium aurantiacum]|uniref:LPXTG cell wall anchor domain-containing protein n=1 Tax=Brevibacterium aurantiacum TaxID=273384 RepID=UPI00005103E8|nr:LPXTG cell wall anchor domain-containing protein [Brevibacterium aurantiacum]MDN5710941.1 LPXTG cell wall anchor domain-containing protein [Brevibacterium aurantiacum]MDN5734962.1 LPXTG cell wall anchor domain-containing protein [Brevibacterium aurantiacum]